MRTRMNKRACLGALAVAFVTIAAPARGVPPVLMLGEVRAPAGRQPEDLATFRAIVERAFRALRLPRESRHGSLILSAALVEFHTVQKQRSHTTTCVVSATLRDSQGGSLRATLEGRVRLHESDRRSREGDRLSMQAAVARALSRVPEAIY